MAVYIVCAADVCSRLSHIGGVAAGDYNRQSSQAAVLSVQAADASECGAFSLRGSQVIY